MLIDLKNIKFPKDNKDLQEMIEKSKKESINNTKVLKKSNKKYNTNEINKEYMDRWIQYFWFSGELNFIKDKCNYDNKKVIEDLNYKIEFSKDCKSEKVQKSVLFYKALIEYIENGEELPDEYKCLKTD